MNFAWTEDHLELRRGAVEFASRELVEGIAERDRAGTFSRRLWDACAGFGLQGLLAPRERDGGGQDLLSAVAVLEGIGYGALDNGMVFSVTAHAASCLEEGICVFAPERAPCSLPVKPFFPSLRYLLIHITGRCNLCCRHCFLGNPSPQELGLGEILKVAGEFVDLQGLRFIVSGGEPLMQKPLV